MVARERASEGGLAAWRRRSLPRTKVYVSQLHARSRHYHRAWAEATEYRIIALPEEKSVDTNKTCDMHMATQIVLFVSGRTTDVSRTVPFYESYTLHRAIPAPAPAIICGAPPSLWCTSWDVLGTVSCILCGSSCCCTCCDLHGRGRVGCSGIRYHVWSCTCHDILGTTSCDVLSSSSCCSRHDLHG